MQLNRFLLHLLKKFDVSVILLLWASAVTIVAGGDVPTYFMSQKCGTILDMEDRLLTALHLRLTDRPVYRPHMSCSLVLRAPPQQRLVMVVQWLDIAAGRFEGACTDFLSAWDGEFGNRTNYVEGLDPKICGKEAPPSVASQSRSVTLYFDSNSMEEGAGFSLLITAFHHGECTDEEFRCDNRRCIDKGLKCDDGNNCGDDSDTCIVSITTAALVVIVVTVIGFIVVGAVVLYLHRDKFSGRKKGADPGDGNQPTMTESTTASTIQDTTTA